MNELNIQYAAVNDKLIELANLTDDDNKLELTIEVMNQAESIVNQLQHTKCTPPQVLHSPHNRGCILFQWEDDYYDECEIEISDFTELSDFDDKLIAIKRTYSGIIND